MGPHLRGDWVTSVLLGKKCTKQKGRVSVLLLLSVDDALTSELQPQSSTASLLIGNSIHYQPKARALQLDCVVTSPAVTGLSLKLSCLSHCILLRHFIGTRM